jgi:hypothetical protein
MHLYSTTFAEEGYWKIVASGELSRDSVWLAHEEVLHLLDETSGVRMVIDLRAVDGRPDMITSILQAELLAHRAQMYTHRIAVIDLELNRTWVADEVLCLSNRGLPIRFFTGEAEALRWISTHQHPL